MKTITLSDNSGNKPIIIPVKTVLCTDIKSTGGTGSDGRYSPQVSISLPDLPGFMK